MKERDKEIRDLQYHHRSNEEKMSKLRDAVSSRQRDGDESSQYDRLEVGGDDSLMGSKQYAVSEATNRTVLSR